MQPRRLFIVGDSLFAHALARMFAFSPEVRVVGGAPSPQTALQALAETLPEAIIVAGASDLNPNEPAANQWGQLLVRFPKIPLIRADLATDHLLLITCVHIEARPESLLAVLKHLPMQTQDVASRPSHD